MLFESHAYLQLQGFRASLDVRNAGWGPQNAHLFVFFTPARRRCQRARMKPVFVTTRLPRHKKDPSHLRMELLLFIKRRPLDKMTSSLQSPLALAFLHLLLKALAAD